MSAVEFDFNESRLNVYAEELLPGHVVIIHPHGADGDATLILAVEPESAPSQYLVLTCIKSGIVEQIRVSRGYRMTIYLRLE
jgi:virulence-associated protein VagC